MKKLTFIILCLEGAILSFNVAASAALVPSIARDFALCEFLVGRIIWLYMLPYGIAALVYGPLVRAFSVKKIELICLSLFSLSNLLAGLAQNINTLFIARFFMGLFGASVIPLGIILIAQHVESDKRGRLVGVFFGITFIGSLLGLFLSGILFWRWIYLIPAIAGVVLTLVIYAYLPSFKEYTTGFKINYWLAFKNKRIISIFTYIFFVSLFYHGIQQWLGVYFSDRFLLNQFLISMLITLTSLSGICGEFLGGIFSDTLGRSKTANLGIILMIVSVFLILIKMPVAVLAIIMFIWGLGWTINHAGISTMLTDLPKEFLNEAASLNSSVRFVAGGLGVALAGLVMQKNFAIGFSVLGAGLILLLIFNRNLLVTD